MGKWLAGKKFPPDLFVIDVGYGRNGNKLKWKEFQETMLMIKSQFMENKYAKTSIYGNVNDEMFNQRVKLCCV